MGGRKGATCAASWLACVLVAGCLSDTARFSTREAIRAGTSEAAREAAKETVEVPAETPRQDLVLDIRPSKSDAESLLTFGEANAAAELVWLDFDDAGSEENAVREFDVDLKGGARLFGMRRFRVRDARNALEESSVAAALRRGGVLVPRHVELKVSIGDEPAAARVVEEGFSKELLESQERRDGVMFRFAADSFPEIRIDAYGMKKIRKSESSSAQLANAEGLLTGFLRGRLAAQEVFDLDLFARWLAVAEVWNAASLLEAVNLRFYFNPITQRIEPIGYRGRPGPAAPVAARVAESAPWAARLLEDEALMGRFTNELRARALEIAEVDSASPTRIARARALAAVGAPVRSNAGRVIRAAPQALELDLNPIPSATLEQALSDHPFLEWVEARGVLRGLPGVWRVAGSLILPEGIGLELSAGTVLRFAPGELLLATGPLLFAGTEDAPVVLEPDPQYGTSWQGVAALRSTRPHSWEHVVVRDTTGIDRAGWILTGGVTFRAAEVRLAATLLDGSSAEDALNLIRSDFAFFDLAIDDTASDAFDCDFSKGTIHGGRIGNVGGDGIDISGSEVVVDGVRFVGIRDKALSVGERSELSAHNLKIEKVGTAAASKDSSELTLFDSIVSDVDHVALMAYQKKEEYGPARLRARNVALNRVARAAVVQHGSSLYVDGIALETEFVDSEQLYKSGPMKK